MAFIVKRDAVVIPAGIPISTTNLIINFGVGDFRNGTYRKAVGYNIWAEVNDNIYMIHAPNAFYGNTTWGFYDDNESQFIPPTNPSTDPNFIPTAGWSPSFTITAA
jgi:hypothetical protein